MKKRYYISVGLACTIAFTSLWACSNKALDLDIRLCSDTPNEEFDAYLTDLFVEEVSANTLNLHYYLADPANYGITDYAVTLGDYSAEARAKSYASLDSTYEEIAAFDDLSLTVSQQFDRDVLLYYIDMQKEYAAFDLYEEPLATNNGIQSQLPILFSEFELSSEKDIKDYLELLSQTDDYFEDILALEKERADAGLFMSDAMLEEVISGCENFISDPDQNFLVDTFENRLAGISDLSEEQKREYEKENLRIIERDVFPAYENMISELSQMMGSGKNDKGLCFLENGKEYFELLVKEYTGGSTDVDDLNLRINNSRTQHMLACSDLLTANPTIFDEMNNLDWTLTDNDEMIALLQEQMLASFPMPPASEYEICYVDPSLSDYLAPAFYITAPIDDYLSNSIYINSASNYSDIYYFTTLAHEGWPGHLYQTMMTYDAGFTPIRTILDYPAYTEGWATYVEMMSFSYAGLEEDVASMLMHNQAATLSLYATSDLGIHYYGWGQEELYELWSSYGITDEESLLQIESLILGDPGNYLKYYVGYMEFEDLKETMQTRYDSAFDEVKFHKTILTMGPAPFSLIEEYFDVFYREMN